jgi:hypothetical protein
VGVQEIKWDKDGISPVDDTFFYGKGNDNYHMGADFFIHRRIRSAVKRVKEVC